MQFLFFQVLKYFFRMILQVYYIHDKSAIKSGRFKYNVLPINSVN